jgi:hypothetical protein
MFGELSNLRTIGLIAGITGLFVTFRIYRGPRWNRANFILFSLFNLCLITISINPGTVNFIRDLLSLREHQHGRLIALLITSNIFLLFFSFYNRAKMENFRLQFDNLLRKIGTEDLGKQSKNLDKIKPVMVIIPAYNEAENLDNLLPRMPAKINGREIGVLVVDDGSDDETAEVVKQHGYLCITNKINRGQGAASRVGYDVLTKHNVLVAVTMDADNQHRPEDIEKLVSPILNEECDLVIGSRILGSHEKESVIRNIGITLFSWIVSLAAGTRITDCSSGFKAFDIKKLRELHLAEDQFQAAEVLLEARKKGLKIKEVPITIINRKHGESKKGKNWSYGINFAKAIIKTWWR